MSDLSRIRSEIRARRLQPDAEVLAALTRAHAPGPEVLKRAEAEGAALVRAIRADTRPGLMESFLAEYGLSTDEGIALMCLAEALLRVPDSDTMDALIEDKIAPSEWGSHLGQSSSSLVNASTWALMLTGRVLREDREPGVAALLRGAVKRLGEPVIRTAVHRAMREMGQQFVLGQTIGEAIRRGAKRNAQGFTFSYDMLGEAAMTAHDADHFLEAYSGAIARLAGECRSDDIRANPGISIKLSALHPRYEDAQRARVLTELVERTASLARQARDAGMGLNIDAEEADRLDLSLDVIEAVLRDTRLAGWDGFGIVVQAYGKRAAPVIDWLHGLAEGLDRRIMVRLVKGAYWDTEIKRAQVEGLTGFPVFARKAATDVSYLCSARKLLGLTDRIYPQFATHNAHTVAGVLEMAGDRDAFEFQRLHGMGEALHDIVRERHGTRCRIYAPVGAHSDLLAYLVRRLLENGANCSFVHQIVDEDVPAETVARDPFAALTEARGPAPVTLPRDIFGPGRVNSRGFELTAPEERAVIDAARAPFAGSAWAAAPILAGSVTGGAVVPVANPADPHDVVGEVTEAAPADIEAALSAARVWEETPTRRAGVLQRAADLYEAHYGELFALIAREAGKTLPDAVAELREAVDFLRYYAVEGTRHRGAPRGPIACISPWNFPLAIFTGQVAAALAAGNAVVAKPAETTTLTAALAVRLLHEAGVPATALQLLPGKGAEVGAALASDPRIAGVCFTGSTATAQRINRAMAATLAPEALLIAETGGLNAMIVDSTALPEQAVRDIVNSAFRSAGQRCSALRMLYLQEDVAERFLTMLYGAMDELRLGNPWDLSTDVGPIISASAGRAIDDYVENAASEGRVLKRLKVPGTGHFVAPAVIRVGGIGDLTHEVFGPVLHVATFRARDLGRVVEAINAKGFGLTFGMHSRIDDRIEEVTSQVLAGNLYINRNQIGAIVGSQPFGGEGLSGTGPKAGGPDYVRRFLRPATRAAAAPGAAPIDPARVQAALRAARTDTLARQSVDTLPGPTGESNRLSVYPRGTVLCLGPGAEAAAEQARIAGAAGCRALRVAAGAAGPDAIDGTVAPDALATLDGAALVAWWGDAATARAIRRALAAREGAILPLATGDDLAALCRLERHVCIDTTAAGGNARLLAEAG